MNEGMQGVPTTEELQHTLALCQRLLPWDAHPLHQERLDFLIRLLPSWRETRAASPPSATRLREGRQPQEL